MRDLAEELVDNLSGSSRLVEAAAIAAQHLGDADSAVALLSQAREWREALRTASLFHRQDLFETTVAPTAAEAAATLLVRHNSDLINHHIYHRPACNEQLQLLVKGSAGRNAVEGCRGGLLCTHVCCR